MWAEITNNKITGKSHWEGEGLIFIESDFDIDQDYDSVNDTVTGLGQPLQERIAEVNELARSKIEAGFKSSALGSQHRYKSNQDYQINLIGKVLANQDTTFKCVKISDNIKSFKAHTIGQLRNVLSDGATIKENILAHSDVIVSALEACSTIAELKAYDIVTGWPT